jgi:phage terminase large subunit GpA-like protein
MTEPRATGHESRVTPLPLFDEERELLIPRQRPDMVAWAEANYVLPRETAQMHGRWSSEYVPFWVEPMRWWSSGTLKELVAAACTQAGKTEFANIAMGYAADVDAGPFLIVLPTEDVAKQRLASRIRPMFRACARLMRKIGNDLSNFNIGKETYLDDMILYVGWANSAITLSDKPIRYLVLDEAAKYPMAVGSDTDPISLGKRRQRGFSLNAKTFIPSSPILEDDLFWREWLHGDPYDWHAPCPHCGAWHQMAWEHIVLDKDDRGRLLPAREYARGGHARYVCPKCGACWTEYDRWQAVTRGRWVQAGAKVRDDGTIEGDRPPGPVRSIRIWAGMLHPIFQTVDGLAAEWAAAQEAKHAGNTKPLQDFINNQLAEPWKETAKSTPIEQLRTHIDPGHVLGLVPPGVTVITRGLDVQIDHIYVADIGWGDLCQAWVLHYDRIETGDTSKLSNWDLVEQYLRSGWPLAQDPKTRRHPALASIDCAYRTEETINFCRQMQRQALKIVPARGSEHMRKGIVAPYKDANRQVLRYDMNEDHYKSALHSMLWGTDEPGPGYLHLPRDVTDEFLQHLTAEEAREIPVKDKRVVIWVNKTGRPNHWWDCLVHARNAAELIGVRWLTPPRPPTKPAGKPVARKPIRTKY